MSKEKHIKAYMFLKLRLKCFRNITTFCYFSLKQNRQQEQDNHFQQFNIFLSHIATNQIKDIQPWVFVCHKPYNSEVEILKFLSNFEHRTWHKFRIFLSKNDKNSKNEEFLSRFLRILNSYVFSVTPIFWSSETILAEVTAILALLHPKMEKFTISPQYRILTEASIFCLWTRSCLSYLSLNSLTIFLSFLVPGLQPTVPVTQLWSPLRIFFIALSWWQSHVPHPHFK